MVRPACSPTGLAPSVHILSPLYRAGLWLAVIIAPAIWRLPLAKYSMSLEPRPPMITSAPWAVAPRPKAAASGADEVRMSCMVTTDLAPVTWTNAAPMASAAASSSSSGTMPRMSYALKIFA